MLYNGVFGCHGNRCYVIFIGDIFDMLYIIGPINVCTDFEINRYKIDEVRKYAKIAFYLIYLTSRDAKRLRHASFRFKSHSGSKVMAQIVVLVFSVTLTLTFDLCYIVRHTYCALCTGISMRSFIRIRPVILGDMAWTPRYS